MRLEYKIWWIWSGWYTYDGSAYLGTQMVQNRALIQTLTAILKNWIINFCLNEDYKWFESIDS